MRAAFEFGRGLKRAFADKAREQKSAAYLFGRFMKQSQNPSTTSGTLSLANPTQTPAPTTTVSSSGQGFGGPAPASPVQPQLPQNPKTTWGGYLTDTNNGLMKDVKDTFTHFIPQNTMPWTNAWKSAPQRYKNLPVDRGLAIAGTAAAGTGLAAGLAAGGLAAAPALGIGSGGAGGAAATAGTGAAAASQTPAGQNMLQRGSQMAGQAADIYNAKIHPLLNKLNYKPEDVLSDAGAALTGNFDSVKGPNWAFNTPGSPVIPIGAPSFPRPKSFLQGMYGSGAGMIPGSNTAGTALAHAGMQ